MKLFLCVTDCNYLLGASADPAAAEQDYWICEDVPETERRIEVVSVPLALAVKLVYQGTPDQHFADGYTAYAAVCALNPRLEAVR